MNSIEYITSKTSPGHTWAVTTTTHRRPKYWASSYGRRWRFLRWF